MASEVADLWVKLSLMSQGFTEGLGKAGAEAEGFSGRMGKIGEGLVDFAKKSSLAIVGVGAVSVKMAGDWQQSMIKLVTSAGEAGGAINGKLVGPIADVSDKLLKMAVETGTSTKQLADGMYFVESAGFHGAAGLQVMRIAAQGAKAEGAQLSTVTDALTTVLHDMGASADQAVPYMDMMIRAVGSGKMTMEQFAGSLHSVLPQARAAGISFQDVAAAIATMTVSGTTADQATQMLGHTIASLQSPNAVAVKAMATFGLSTLDLKEHLGQRGLLGTFGLIDKAILDHMGPDGLYLQNVFNKSQVAAQDLNTMLGNMPSGLRKLATEMMNGTVDAKQYTASLNVMPENMKAMGSEFLTVYKNANSFNQSLRNGVPGADTFAGSLRKVLGDTVDTNTALQIGGQNLATFAAYEQYVSDGAKNAGNNIETWGTITQGFNFRIDQAKELLQTTAIKIGTVLLPKLMDLMDYISRTAGPILHDMGQKFHDALDSPLMHEAQGIVVQFLQNFGRTLKDAWIGVVNLWHAIQPVAELLAGMFLFGVKAVGLIMANVVGPAIEAVTGFLRDHANTIKFLAEVILPIFIGRLLIIKTMDFFTSIIGGIDAMLLGFQKMNRTIATGQIFDTIRLKAMYAGDAVKNLATQEGEVAVAGGAAAGIGGFGGFLSKVGGAIPIVGAAVVGISALSSMLDNNSESSRKATVSLDEFTRAAANTANGAKLGVPEMQRVVDLMRNFGDSESQLERQVTNQSKLFGKGIIGKDVYDDLHNLRKEMSPTMDAFAQYGVIVGKLNQHLGMGAAELKNYDGVLAQLVQTGHGKYAAQVIDNIRGVVDAQGHAVINAAQDFPQYYQAVADATNKLDLAKIPLDDTTQGLNDQAGAALNGSSAMDAFTQSISDATTKQQDMSAGLNADRALDDYYKQVQAVTKALQDNGTKLDGNSDAAMNNRDALRGAVQAMVDDYNANRNLGDTQDVATDKLKKQIDQLVNQSSQSDATRKKIRAYIDTLNIIPPSVDTTINADTSAALQKVAALKARILELNGLGITVSPTGQTTSKTKTLPAYAEGGFVNAPRGAAQLAIVHGGEYIVSLNEMNDSSYANSGAGGGMARGGAHVVNIYVQGSVIAERDLTNLVQTLMLQLGARYSTSYTPYKR